MSQFVNSAASRLAVTACLIFALTACGGGGGDSGTSGVSNSSTNGTSGSGGNSGSGSSGSYAVGGAISGLSASGLVLTDNGGDNLSVASGATSFTFATEVPSSGTYDVAVQAQPTGENCSVASSTGTVNSSSVTNVQVTCSSSSSGATASEIVLHSFTDGTDGGYPAGSVVLDSAGNVYGATETGGAYGDGVVFKITPSGTETVLHSFDINNGDASGPSSGLTSDSAGDFFGVTDAGGADGSGAVYEVTPSGTETVLYSFTGYCTTGGSGNDGCQPEGNLLRDSAGNLYGVTVEGGTYGDGTVFKLTPAGTETVLYSFTGGNDGNDPQGGLVIDTGGDIYGVTNYGGADGAGTVFKIMPSSGALTVLYSFTDGADGGTPYAGLIMGPSGNFYGTTSVGGAFGGGTVFEITSSGALTVLHSFGTDAQVPQALLLIDPAGNLYGTTAQGGNAPGSITSAWGTVFELMPSGTETVLHVFTGCSDGSTPEAGLVMDPGGNLYGTTSGAGPGDCPSSSGLGYGTVFKVIP